MKSKEHSVLILDNPKQYNENFLNDNELNIIGIEPDRKNGLEIVEQNKPEIIVKVINDDDGCTFNDRLNFINNVKEISTDSQLLVVNVDNNKEMIEQLIKAGVNGLHDGKSTSLKDGLKLMKQYQTYLSHTYHKILLEEFRKISEKEKGVLYVDHSIAKTYLSNREIEVLNDLVENGGNYEASSERLFISPKTLKNHMTSIMKKLDANNRTHIIPIGIKNGVLKLKCYLLLFNNLTVLPVTPPPI